MNDVSIQLLLFSERLTKPVRDMYIRYTFQVKYDGRNNLEVIFEEMFVDLRIQMFEDSTQLPEILAYRDVEEIQKVK